MDGKDHPHEENDPLRCSVCRRSFPTVLGTRRHQNKCTGNRRRCRICNTELSSIRNLNNHEVRCRARRDLQEKEKQQNVKKKKGPSGSKSCGKCGDPATTSRYVCGVCDKSFSALRPFLAHRKTHYDQHLPHFTCNICKKQFGSKQELTQHAITHSSDSSCSSPESNHDSHQQENRRLLHCVDCDETFQYWHQLQTHRTIHRSTMTNQSEHQGVPWEVHPEVRPPWVEIRDDGTESVNSAFRTIYQNNRATIIAGHDAGRVRGIYNFPLNDFNGETHLLQQHLEYIFANEIHSFRVNLAFGVILRHVETGRYRYYTAYYNSTLLDNPARINNRVDLSKFFHQLQNIDLVEFALKTKESTKWQKVFVTNVNYYVYRTGFPIGNTYGVKLPRHIRKKRTIIGFEKSQHRTPYKDHLCIFRCLTWALQKGRGRNFENEVKGYYTEWKDYLQLQGRTDLPDNAKKYNGIMFEDLPDFEQCFSVRISVYSLNANDSCTRLYASILDPDEKESIDLPLNMYGNHFSLITNFKAYAKKFSCGFCGRSFTKVQKLKQHEKVCDTRTKYVYPGGLYTPAQSVFEEMEQTLGIKVDKGLQFYPWFAVFDFESLLQKMPNDVQEDEDQQGTRWTTEHVPICVSVASNVPGYLSPHCIIETNPDILVQRMCEYLEEIQLVTVGLAVSRWKSVFEELDKVKSEFPMGDDDSDFEDIDGEETVEDLIGNGLDESDESDVDHETAEKLHAKRVNSMCEKFTKYTTALPVLGFNSSRYDLNLIKCRFPKHLHLTTEADYVIKKCNQYTAIVTSKFRFLDISNFLAAGCSYSKFLLAYDVSESKSYFPYEYLDHEDKLKDPSLPPYEAFMSQLKNHNVLEIEHAEWVKKGRKGTSPKTGPEKYQDLLDIWQDRGMTTMADFLEYYVNLDTGPFVQAAEKLMKYYFEMGVDVFKVAISAPGVARKLLFENAKKSNIYFSSFSSEDADLYHKVKKCAFGGPSIVFKRHAKVDETLIRHNKDKLCKNILGYDANSLYLYSIGEDLPVLMPIRRAAETQFKPKVSWKHLEMYQWMNWLMESEGIHIQHKMNCGKEFPVGPYKLDGYYSEGVTRYAVEFYGCWVHGHKPEECGFRKEGMTSEKSREILSKKNTSTKKREAYIRSRGFNLRTIYECEFAKMKKDNSSIRSVINDMLPEFYISHPHCISVDTILKSVERGELTGLVQVDIRVPEKWPIGKEQAMTPQEYFSEMSPIFCNSEVHFDEWGTTMQNYSMSYMSGEFSDKRKLLIGGMAATKIFIATNLLKWYLEKGLEVTRIYEVVEYKLKKCFKGFCDFISDARRKGDEDESKEILGQTCKVLGNASYGSLLLDKTKHINVKYVHDKNKAHMEVNNPLFKNLSELPDEMYEIELSKKVVKLDLPIILGFYILQTAKLRLLGFYYDCLDYYLDRKDYELTHCDTDSIYFAISSDELSKIIIPEKRLEFERSLYGFCNDNPFTASDQCWFPRQCCDAHIQHDKRERGLFKLEASGTELIALASKTYYLKCPDSQDSVKAKGINRSAISDPMPLYRKALVEKKSTSVANVGFRAYKNKVFTYSQIRRGFSFFYVKREVQPNGIDTKPLQCILNPWQNYNVQVLKKQKHCLSNDYQALMEHNGLLFRSCTHMFLHRKAVLNKNEEIAREILRAQSEAAMLRIAKQITVTDSWYDQRDDVMKEVIQQKIKILKYRIIIELKEFKGRMIVHPNDHYHRDNYWTCGLPERMAEIVSPKQYPGGDELGRIWERLTYDEEFMNA